MLKNLGHYGIRGIAQQLLKRYLTGQLRYTTFDGENSEKLPVQFGVPQGYILGPLLFLLCNINDLINCHNGENTYFILYADDNNIFVMGRRKEEAFLRANRVHTFMKCNLLNIYKHGKLLFHAFLANKTF